MLEEGIHLAGLGGKGFSAKSFHPTGATAAVNMDVEPDKVRRLGRWKTQEVFYYHYVQNKMPSNYTTKERKKMRDMRTEAEQKKKRLASSKKRKK